MFTRVNAQLMSIQRKYRPDWRLSVARVNDSFCVLYFQVLEESKHTGSADVEDIARRLMTVLANSSGRWLIWLTLTRLCTAV
jgi:hypothetical protein